MNKSPTRFFTAAALIVSFWCMSGMSARADDAYDTCVSTAKKTNITCWNRCAGDDDCNARCDSRFESAKRSCATPSTQATAGIADKTLSGTKQSGQDGCYFGECPGNLTEKIDKVKDKPAPEPEPEEPVVDEPERKTPVRRQPRAAPTTNICQTPAFWCFMNQVGPVNYPCWCGNAFGVAQGVTVPAR